MEKLSSLFLWFFFAILLLSQIATCQEVDDEREFNYEKDGERGPGYWGNLKPEWHKCKSGMMQSPIDLLHDRVQVVSHLGDLKIKYKPSNATLKNRGHDMMVKWDSGAAGFMELNGIKYFLKQCHWHSPSEHTINGNLFDLEAHLVHESSSGEVAVIGIFYQIGQPDHFLSIMENHLNDTSNTNEEKKLKLIDPTLIRMAGSIQYYRYIGSLTVPPCTENVIWTMIKQVRTVSAQQVKLLRVAVHDDSDTNARPLKPLNNRTMQLQKLRVTEEDEEED